MFHLNIYRISKHSVDNLVTLIATKDKLCTCYTGSVSESYVTTDGQPVSVSWCQAPIWGQRPDFYYCLTVAGLLMWGAFSHERAGLSFRITAGPRQRTHSRVRVPRDSWPYFTVSDSRLDKPGGPGPRIYIPQALGSLFVAYDSQGYGAGSLNRLQGGAGRFSQSFELVYRQSVRLGAKPFRLTTRDLFCNWSLAVTVLM
jgi:hypothetical protein